MSGIQRSLTLDPRHIAKHLPNTPQMEELLNREGFAHIFHDLATLEQVAIAILERGEFTGNIRGHERYGLYFPQPIGYRISVDGTRIALYYGELKVKGDKYHVIPRTKPSR